MNRSFHLFCGYFLANDLSRESGFPAVAVNASAGFTTPQQPITTDQVELFSSSVCLLYFLFSTHVQPNLMSHAVMTKC